MRLPGARHGLVHREGACARSAGRRWAMRPGSASSSEALGSFPGVRATINPSARHYYYTAAHSGRSVRAAYGVWATRRACRGSPMRKRGAKHHHYTTMHGVRLGGRACAPHIRVWATGRPHRGSSTMCKRGARHYGPTMQAVVLGGRACGVRTADGVRTVGYARRVARSGAGNMGDRRPVSSIDDPLLAHFIAWLCMACGLSERMYGAAARQRTAETRGLKKSNAVGCPERKSGSLCVVCALWLLSVCLRVRVRVRVPAALFLLTTGMSTHGSPSKFGAPTIALLLSACGSRSKV
jgi:hypothetical protein